MTRKLHSDYETFSRVDLKKAGLYKYAESETTGIHVNCYAFDKERVKVWVPRKALPEAVIEGFKRKRPHHELIIQERAPQELVTHIEQRGQYRAHNAMFERRVTAGPAGQRHGIPEILATQMVCTMAKASAHGLPAALEHLAEALDTHRKKTTGSNDMRYLMKPRSDGTFATPEEEPERFVNLYDYCIDDVEAERAADEVVPDLTKHEQEVYALLDQEMNDRGIAADLESVKNIIELVNEHRKNIEAEVRRRTASEWHPEGIKPSQTGVLAEWCRGEGYPQLPNLQADTVKKAVKDRACPLHVRKVLALYSTFNMKAVTKYPVIERAICANGRLHGMFLYHAADTGRWSSKIVQLHNLYRPKIENPEEAIEVFRTRDLDDVKFAFPDHDPMVVFASCVRSVLTASRGKVLVFPDFAGIEARVNAWLWGEEWKLKAFRDYDTITGYDEKGEAIRKGPDLYKVAYAKSFSIDPKDVSKAGRQVGKVQELALGYQGGVGAFVTMAEQAGINLDEMAAAAFDTLPRWAKAEAADFYQWAVEHKRTHDLPVRTFITLDAFKRLWRAAHPAITKGWTELENAARSAILNPGKEFSCANGKLAFKVWRQWLCMRLPSGRPLWYFRPSIDKDGKTVRFWGTDTYTRKWCRTSTYGGKLDENAVQAISRDLLVFSKFNLRAANYPLIGSVHDEPIAETLASFGSFEEVRGIMQRKPSWCQTLPLAVDGHRQYRYRK